MLCIQKKSPNSVVMTSKQNQQFDSSPGFDEVAAKLNAILERAAAIDNELLSLETLKQQNNNQCTEMKSFGPDKYVDFQNCQKRFRQQNIDPSQNISQFAIPCPSSKRYHDVGRQEANGQELCQIMDIINDLRIQVSNLATRQNQMKSELNKIRGRLC